MTIQARPDRKNCSTEIDRYFDAKYEETHAVEQSCDRWEAATVRIRRVPVRQQR